MLTQQFNDAVAARRTSEPGQAFEHRQVRFAGAELFQALPPGDPHARTSGNLLQQFVDERRLADAWLARDEHDLTIPRQSPIHPLSQCCEFGLAAKNAQRFGRRQDARALFGIRSDGCTILAGSEPDESIAAAMRGLDIAR